MTIPTSLTGTRYQQTDISQKLSAVRTLRDQESLGLIPATQGHLLPTGLSEVDAQLAGGLELARSHELLAERREVEDPSVASFALALAAQALGSRQQPLAAPLRLFWIGSQVVRSPQALADFHFDSEHCFFAQSRRDLDSLWVAEEVLRSLYSDGCPASGHSRGNGLVDLLIVELLGLSLTQSLRLNSRLKEIATQGIAPPLTLILLRSLGGRHPQPQPSTAAASRWQVAAQAQSARVADLCVGDGRLRWRLSLVKNRRGPVTCPETPWIMEHHHASHSLALASDLRDRSAVTGTK